jgi:hypothetical protein
MFPGMQDQGSLRAERGKGIFQRAILQSVAFKRDSSLGRVGELCFSGARIERIPFPKSLVVLVKMAFYEANIGVIVFPHGCQLNEIGEWCFEMCTIKHKIVIPKGVRTIKVRCFRHSQFKQLEFESWSSVAQMGANGRKLFREMQDCELASPGKCASIGC